MWIDSDRINRINHVGIWKVEVDHSHTSWHRSTVQSNKPQRIDTKPVQYTVYCTTDGLFVCLKISAMTLSQPLLFFSPNFLLLQDSQGI